MGSVYAANTLGAIVGALVVSLMLVPWIGTQQTQRVLLCGRRAQRRLIVLLPYVRAQQVDRAWPPARRRGDGAAAWLSEHPAGARRTDRLRPAHGDERGQVADPLYRRRPQLHRRDHAAGTTARSRSTSTATWKPPPKLYDMKLQRMVGHLPAILHPESEVGARHRLRRGRFGRHLHALPRHREHHHLRDRAGDSADLDALLRRAELRGATRTRRRTSSSTTRGIT